MWKECSRPSISCSSSCDRPATSWPLSRKRTNYSAASAVATRNIRQRLHPGRPPTKSQRRMNHGTLRPKIVTAKPTALQITRSTSRVPRRWMRWITTKWAPVSSISSRNSNHNSRSSVALSVAINRDVVQVQMSSFL